MPTYSYDKTFDGTPRPAAYGSVAIEYEILGAGTLHQRERPVLASGYVLPMGSTAGRKSAPEPQSNFRIGMTQKVPRKALALSARNTGRVDMDKGHIFALELGGPDVAHNILPQFSQFQRNGVWRRMEVEAHEIASDTSDLVFMSVAIVYGNARTVSRSLVPSGFLVNLYVEGAGGRSLRKSYQIENRQDATDDRVGLARDPDVDASDQMDVVYGDAPAGSPFDRPVLGVRVNGQSFLRQELARAAAASPSITRRSDVMCGKRASPSSSTDAGGPAKRRR